MTCQYSFCNPPPLPYRLHLRIRDGGMEVLVYFILNLAFCEWIDLVIDDRLPTHNGNSSSYILKMIMNFGALY